MKIFLIQKFLSPESPRSSANEKFSLDSLPPEQKVARQNAITKLDFYIDSQVAFSAGDKRGWNRFTDGVKHMMTLDSTRQKIQNQMRDIKNLLQKPYNPENWNQQIETHLNRIEPDGSANLEIIPTRMSKRVFLQRILGPTMAAKILVPIPFPEKTETLRNSQEQQEELKQRRRLESFLQTLETTKSWDLSDRVQGNNGKVTLGSAILHTQKLLWENKISEAKEYFARAFDDKYRDIRVYNIISSDEGLANAIRRLGNTQGAVNKSATLEAVNSRNIENENADTKALYNNIETALKNTSLYQQEAEKSYQEMTEKLNPRSLDYKLLTANPQDTIAMIQTGMILDKTISDFIRKNSSKNLPKILRDFDDMKGFHGWNNWSDENVRLARDVIIMVASFVVTAGAWTLATALAWSARLASAARFANAAGHFRNGNYVRWAISGAKAASATTVQAGARTVATASSLANKNALTRTAGSALTFTTADQLLRSAVWQQEWEQTANFGKFFNNLAKNTAMFGAFAGMEKFVTGPIISRFMKPWVEPSARVTIARFWTLSLGDIAVMQALHAAETGKMEWSWWAVFAAVAMRVGFSTVEKYFPKLTEKFHQKPQQEQQRLLESSKNLSQNNPSPKNPSQNNISRSPQKISNAVENFKTQVFTPKDTLQAWHQMNISPVGTRAEFKIFDRTTPETTGRAVYEKIANGSWKHISSNISAISMADDILKLQRNGKGATFLDGRNKNLEITETTLRTPVQTNISAESATLARMRARNRATVSNESMIARQENLQKIQHPRKSDSIVLPNGEKWNYTGSGNRWQREWSQIFKDGNELRKDVLNTTRPNTAMQNQIDDLVGVNQKTGYTRENQFLTAEEAALQQKNLRHNADLKYPVLLKNPQNLPKNPINSLNEVAPKLGENLQKAVMDVKVGKPGTLRNFFKENWIPITTGAVGLRLISYFVDSQKINPFFVIPELLPTDTPETAFEKCMLCLTENGESQIHFDRHDAERNIIFTQEHREKTSQKWMQTTEWKNLMQEWNTVMATMEVYEKENADILIKKMNEINAYPSVHAVKDLQRCIGMMAEDSKMGQDGILGPNTTASIREFLVKCQAQYSFETTGPENSENWWENVGEEKPQEITA